MNKIKYKRILISILVIVGIVLIAGSLYFAIKRVIPQTQSSSQSTTQDVALKSYNDAIDAEKKNDYNRAIDSYNKALPYYKDKGASSIQDMNQAYNIEARIKAISAHQAALDKAQKESEALPNVEISK